MKKPTHHLMTPEHRRILMALSAVAPGPFKVETPRSLKSEGSGFVLKLTAPKRAHRGYKLLVFIAYHKNTEEHGSKFQESVVEALRNLRADMAAREVSVLKQDAGVKISDTNFICTHVGVTL